MPTASPVPLVVARITRGLGNQLFQYATGLALARRLGAELKFDLEPMRSAGAASADLAGLGVALPEVSPDELRRLAPQWAGPFRNKLILLRHRLTPFARRRWIREENYDFDSRLLQIRAPVYLDGYWQSERYFAELADELRVALAPPAPTERARALGDELARVPTIAIHVRRGDYVTNDDAARFHGCCSLDYYRRAIEWMASATPDCRHAIFSDDPEWAAQNLRVPGDTLLVAGAPAHSALEDFHLLTRCSHFIIANSTFSWWAAWLSSGRAPRVVAPRRWFLGREINPADRFPAGWHLIDA